MSLLLFATGYNFICTYRQLQIPLLLFSFGLVMALGLSKVGNV